ncbi:16S rRNA (uracil(1498)-N(3))-methyltransferase [Marinomonas sp. M1K-6]|uniref:Ribosomal RNA small subunit methyltransferase E n=1 Tax=Marinomonas profundi TaxID=2726122 RepID=A0A847R7R5_9GAMM|nr:16S rRNA (uracil(1498)-N(3))-methyltransferase [Marinomonas profundi]NLQ18116.1 16S rRNA (uracil(1498)-N(3))-methyltransferase [Marinomonas profundi]UDV04100.1 16S rRNA (uracil(1498)-N(3))-methyltransferase [Marinomonas profundi]
MNIILLDAKNTLDDGLYGLTLRQQTHISTVIKAQQGDVLRVGLLNGKIGEGVYQPPSHDKAGYIHSLALFSSPPEPLPMVLVMALPRPNMLKRTLQNISAMGVKDLYLIHSAKVEKSYWQSPVLQTESIQQCLLEGLEQAKDTLMPNWSLIPRFRPFVEDQLPAILQDKVGLLAHPYLAERCPVDIQQPCVLALGPEGGWNEFEVSKWHEAGMQSVHLGDRILKVETVVPVLLSRLYPA